MRRRDFISGIFCAGAALASLRFAYNKFHTNNAIKINNSDEKCFLNHIAIAVSSHCNLSCKRCDTFSPLGKEEFVSAAQFAKDFKIIRDIQSKDSVRNLQWIGFSGGEPLLNPELTKIIYICDELFPNVEKFLITNGILLESMGKDFWEAMKNCNIQLVITKYPININRSEYERIAKQYGINLTYDKVRSNKLYDLKKKTVIDDNYNQNGFDWGQNILDLKGSQNIEKMNSCPHRGLIFYARGNIYYCYVHAFIKLFIDYFKVDIPITKQDYIKVANVKNLEEMEYFLGALKPLCKYCKQCHDTCYGADPHEWGFTERKITEWT